MRAPDVISGDRPAPRDDLHTLAIPDAYAALAAGPRGLSAAEAAGRLRQYGPNTLQQAAGRPLIWAFLANFTHLMALLLWAGGLLGFLAQMPQLGLAIWTVNLINGLFSFWQEYRAERAAAALRALLPAQARVLRDGAVLEIPRDTVVPGDLLLLGEGDLVAADGRLVEATDLRVDQSTLTGESRMVPKGCEPYTAAAADHAATPNVVFAGTTVVAGKGKALVFATGMRSAFGAIAGLTQSIADTPSPLQLELARLTRTVTVIAVGVGAIFFLLAVTVAGVGLAESLIFALGMIVAFVPEGLLPTVTLALGIGVQRMARRNALVKRLSAVETLGCTEVICTDKTGTLTQNTMTVRNLWAGGRPLEVTGNGYDPSGTITADGRPLSLLEHQELICLLRAVSLCNDARLVAMQKAKGKRQKAGQGVALTPNADAVRPPQPSLPVGAGESDLPSPAGSGAGGAGRKGARGESGRGAEGEAGWAIRGDPTEAALQVLAYKGGLDPEAEALAAPRIHEIPFESRRKLMSTVHRAGGAGTVVYVKGAPDEVLARCTTIRSGGQAAPLDDGQRATIAQAKDRFARGGLRVLGVAMRELVPPMQNPVQILTQGEGPRALRAQPWPLALRPGSMPDARATTEARPGREPPYTAEGLERDLTFLGLVAMYDPPRPEVAAAVEQCHRAGIRIMMITGDDGLTAESIARRLGIVAGERVRLITGAELDTLDDAALAAALAGEVIFARAAPEHKLRIVSALQQLGRIVAVTGDGVNDAPALKRADIGVAMGRSGTDVARESADMILTDDNFATIVAAIEEGRAVYANIRKFATYIFTSNIPEAMPFVCFALSGGRIPLALTVMQILAIDLGTDMVPALGLGAEPAEAGVMDRPPRKRSDHIIDRSLLMRSLLYLGLIQGAAAMVAFFAYYWQHGYAGQWLGLPDSGPLYAAATTMTLAAIVATQIGNLFAQRTERASIVTIQIFRNRLIWLGIGIEIMLIVAIAYAPWLQAVFGSAPLAATDWLQLLLYIPILLIADELRKFVVRWRLRGQRTTKG